MRISCVKCSTLYELDDRLIPPSGAPVQCTRCGHVFTAKPEPLPSQSPATPATAAEPKPGGAQRGATQMFGSLGAPGRTGQPAAALPGSSEPKSAARAGTQLFGALPSDSKRAASQIGARTQMFGSPPSGPAAAVSPSKATESSPQSVAAKPGMDQSPAAARPARAPTTGLNELGEAPRSAAAPVRRETQMFGAPVASARTAPLPATATQQFGRLEVKPEDLPRSGALPPFDTVPPSRRPSVAANQPRNLTPVFGTGAVGMPSTESESFPPFEQVTLPPAEPSEGRGRAQRRRASLELPVAEPLFRPEAHEDPGLAMRAQLRRRNRVAVAAVLAAAVALPGGIAIRMVLKRHAALPDEVVSAEENALTLLRRDDRRSRKQAIAEIDSLVRKYPELASPAAIRLLALALDLDDVKLVAQRIQGQSDELNRTIARLQERTSSSDWETGVAAARAQLAALEKESAPLLEEAKALDRQVNAAYSVLLGLTKDAQGREEAAAIRAQAVYYGVKGSDKAVGLLERYRQLGAKDGWDAIAMAEYAANAPVAPGIAREARRLNERTRSADSAFLRAYVMAARLALAEKEYDAAATSLDAVAALNPSHEVARQLIAWVEEARRIETAKPAAAAPQSSGR